MKIQCPIPDCARDDFAGMGAFEEHLRTRHRVEPDALVAALHSVAVAAGVAPGPEPQWYRCTVPGCSRKFGAARGLQVHVARSHTTDPVNGDLDNPINADPDPLPDDADDDDTRYELAVIVMADELALIETECFLNHTTTDDWLEQLVNTQLAQLAKDRTIRKILEYRRARTAE